MMRVRPYLLIRTSDLVDQRPPGAGEDVHFTEELAAAMIEEYSEPGDLVLDPFAGFGTTLVVAERLGRRALGVELLAERVALVRGRLTGGSQILHGDARDLTSLVAAPVDLVLTSPPYMTVNEHPENPLTGYETLDGDYPTYLDQLGRIFEQVRSLLRPGGNLVVNVANITNGGVVTPLAWDLAAVLRRFLTFRQEVFLCWDHPPSDYTGDYCLVFERTG